MPRNRPEVEREEKVESILALAESACRAHGYAGLSVAAIARDLGVAQNSVYWYFPSKDHLFVAVAQRMLDAVAARKPRRSGSTMDRILWLTDAFEHAWQVCAPMYQLSETSVVIGSFLTELDELISTMLDNALAETSTAAEDRRDAIDSFRAVVEGAYIRRLSRPSRHRVLRHAAARIANVQLEASSSSRG